MLGAALAVAGLDESKISRGSARVAASPIERKTPRNADEPGAESGSVSERVESLQRSDDRFLRDVFRVFAMTQHAERDAKCQRAGLGHMRVTTRVHINRRQDAMRRSQVRVRWYARAI